MKKILLGVLILCFLSACQERHIYIEEQTNDTIASCLVMNGGKRAHKVYKIILKDSIDSDKALVNILDKLGVMPDLKKDAYNFNVNYKKNSDIFFYVKSSGFSDFDSCKEFFRQAYLFYKKFDNKYSFLVQTPEDVVESNRETMKYVNDYLSGKRHYYGDSMKPVTEYLNRTLSEYTPLSSSDIIRKGDYYTVRHIYETKNFYGGVIKCDKMFFINDYGEVVDVKDFLDYTMNRN